MTNPYRKPEPAIIRDLDGEPQLNRAALRLLFGCDTFGDPTDLPGSVQAAGIRRRQHYEAATGNTTPNMLDVLAYWARHDGITLYSEDTTGHRTDITMHGAGQTMPDLVVITDTDDRLIAAAANIGFSSRPMNGNNTPAAIGTPSEL